MNLILSEFNLNDIMHGRGEEANIVLTMAAIRFTTPRIIIHPKLKIEMYFYLLTIVYLSKKYSFLFLKMLIDLRSFSDNIYYSYCFFFSSRFDSFLESVRA